MTIQKKISHWEAYINNTEINDKKSYQIKKNIISFNKKPLISILMPVYNVDSKYLSKALESIESQLYENWELCIVDDHSTNRDTISLLNSINNKNIKIKRLSENGHICKATNEAAKMATGEYYVFMDNDDELTIDALYEIVKAINDNDEIDIIYSDEDKID